MDDELYKCLIYVTLLRESQLTTLLLRNTLISFHSPLLQNLSIWISFHSSRLHKLSISRIRCCGWIVILAKLSKLYIYIYILKKQIIISSEPREKKCSTYLLSKFVFHWTTKTRSSNSLGNLHIAVKMCKVSNFDGKSKSQELQIWKVNTKN